MNSGAERVFIAYCKGLNIPAPVTEYRFHAVRRWRFDYAWPDAKVALEVEGGVWSGGRHTRGVGFVKDMEKYNTAGLNGWLVLRCQPADLNRLETAAMVQQAIQQRAKTTGG